MPMTAYKGYNGTIILTKQGVVIKRGAKGFFFGGGMLRGDKTIPYGSITAVQLKKAGFVSGYIQLSVKGGIEAKGGAWQASSDENSVSFYSNKNREFMRAKDEIEKRISQVSSATNVIDDIEKLASLYDRGIINEEEFSAKKSQLLGLDD